MLNITFISNNKEFKENYIENRQDSISTHVVPKFVLFLTEKFI
jgi:hypothetical protein